MFYKDIGKEFLDQNGGLSGEIMPDYLHLASSFRASPSAVTASDWAASRP